LNVAIVGSTGILGQHVTARLIERGHRVSVLVRPDGRRRPMEHARLGLVRGDIFNSAALSELMRDADVALHLATAIPPPGPDMDWSQNDRVRREGTAKFLQAAAHRSVAKCVVQSIAMIAPSIGDAWATESSEVSTDSFQSAIDMEDLVAQSKIPSTVLRGGLFYGPGAKNTSVWNNLAKNGTLQLPEDGSGYVSLIHIVDMSKAFVCAVESAITKPLLNIVDDAPPTWSDLFGYIARRNGMTTLHSGAPRRFPNFRTSNALAKKTLGWEPTFPTFLSGWHFE